MYNLPSPLNKWSVKNWEVVHSACNLHRISDLSTISSSCFKESSLKSKNKVVIKR